MDGNINTFLINTKKKLISSNMRDLSLKVAISCVNFYDVDYVYIKNGKWGKLTACNPLLYHKVCTHIDSIMQNHKKNFHQLFTFTVVVFWYLSMQNYSSLSTICLANFNSITSKLQWNREVVSDERHSRAGEKIE